MEQGKIPAIIWYSPYTGRIEKENYPGAVQYIKSELSSAIEQKYKAELTEKDDIIANMQAVITSLKALIASKGESRKHNDDISYK